MDPALRIVVALVLLGAAAAKLRDRRALVAAVGDHGVPATLRPAVDGSGKQARSLRAGPAAAAHGATLGQRAAF